MTTCGQQPLPYAVAHKTVQSALTDHPSRGASVSVSDLTPGEPKKRENTAGCVRRTDACVTREILGETVIVPVRQHVGNLDAIYVLDEVGTAIWRLLDGETGVAQIVASLCEEYEVSEDNAADDVAEFLAALEGAGLTRRSSGGGDVPDGN